MKQNTTLANAKTCQGAAEVKVRSTIIIIPGHGSIFMISPCFRVIDPQFAGVCPAGGREILSGGFQYVFSHHSWHDAVTGIFSKKGSSPMGNAAPISPTSPIVTVR